MVGNVIIGTRGSTLAMWQAQWVTRALLTLSDFSIRE